MAVRMTIIGLGQIGASIGLALAEHNQKVNRTGHDRAPEIARLAKKMGAVDAVSFNLHDSVDKAEVIILAIPVDEIRSTLEMIAPDLQPNALIIDTSPIKVSITEWAKELLPPDRHFVTFTPSLNPAYLHETASGIDAAHADLFHKSLTLITSLPGANPDAVKFAADLATLVGSKPLFADAYESDGLVAATRLLPQILAAATVNATIDQPGWTEARKFAGQAYVQATEPAAHLTDTNRLGQTFLLNRENVVRVIDNLTGALNQIREALAEEDEATLHALLHNAREDRRIWFIQREMANWEPNVKSEMPRAGDVVGRLFGIGRRRTEK